jgi:hypothetical protein
LTKNVGYCCHFQKQPEVNNQSLGENSPNLVTLLISNMSDAIRRVTLSTSKPLTLAGTSMATTMPGSRGDQCYNFAIFLS